MGGSGHKLEPCGFMRRSISGLVDGTLRGAIAVYARFHIARCVRCRTALEGLRALRDRLRAACAPGDEELLDAQREKELAAKLDRIDLGAVGEAKRE
jgi:hypothetical protein